MVKLDNAPDPKKRAAQDSAKRDETRQAAIFNFSQNVLNELNSDNVPTLPINYSIYFERMLDEQPEDFRQKVGETLSLYSDEIDAAIDSNIRVEKEIKQSFIQIKSMLQAVALIYKNLNVMKAIVKKRRDGLANNMNLLALQNTITGFGGDLTKLTALLEKHLEVIKINYEEIGKVFKLIEERSIYDTTYEVYNKKFFISALENEINSIKRYGYEAAFLMLKTRDELIESVKNLKERSNIFKSISQSLLNTSRRSDVVAHYGDGCFAILMKYTGENGAKMACDRIRAMLANIRYDEDGKEFKLDAQIVYGMLPKEGSVEQIVSNALDAFNAHKDETEPVFLG